MKISKSILSPSHGRRHEPPLSLPTSISRRLKANGSIKGGQSPATTGMKRGSGFENPEPSSPKVTCIGQVKMKTKKKVITQTRSLSNTGGERGLLLVQNQKSNCNSSVHFQPQDRNQRWVHLPLTIYEGLRDFSCLFPSCRRSSSCFSTNDKEIETKANGSRDVVARWLVSLQDVEAETMESSTMRSISSRRHVFEGVEFKDIQCESVELKEGTVEEEEKGRVGICVPPKNALLLMRCRSDPMKMADITNRFLQSPTRKQTDEQVEDREEIRENEGIECRLQEETVDLVENEENPEAVEVIEMDEEKFKSGELRKETELEDEEESEIKALAAAEANSIEQVAESTGNIQNNIHSYSSFSENSNAEHAATLEEEEEEEEEKFKSTIEKIIEETLLLKDIEEEEEANAAAISVSKVEYPNEPRKHQNESILPDYLLLMMCEPKLSMEVSKETWVCSSSTRDIQAKEVKKNKQVSEEQNKSQPPRSSCSLPSMSSMATMIEHKLLNTLAYEPLVLTRCKSEPMRIAAPAKLEPGTCFWKNRKIEPHRRATFGFGAAGVGF